MKLAPLILVAVTLTSLDAAAASRRPLRRITAGNDVAITFLNDSGARAEVLDAGTVTRPLAARRTSRSSFVVRTFAIRLDRSSGESSGTGTLRAFLENPGSPCTYRLDGIALGATPVVIDAAARFGEVRPHRLEIEVPVDAPPGVLFTSINWELTTD